MTHRQQIIDPRKPDFYIESGCAQLTAGPPPIHGGGKVGEPHWNVTLQLLVFEEPMFDRILDIKEQMICVHEEIPELLLEGWAPMVRQMLLNPEVGMFMPNEFISYSLLKNVLSLKTVKTADDYEKAFKVKSRLGRFIKSQAQAA